MRKGLHVEMPREPFEEPGLGIGRGCVGMEARKATVKIATESGLLVELESCDHAPGEFVTAQDTGQCLQRHGCGEDGGCGQRPLLVQAERRDRRRTQLNPGSRFILIGSDEAIEQAQQQQDAHN